MEALQFPTSRRPGGVLFKRVIIDCWYKGEGRRNGGVWGTPPLGYHIQHLLCRLLGPRT
jgi:hypothetical protein